MFIKAFVQIIGSRLPALISLNALFKMLLFLRKYHQLATCMAPMSTVGLVTRLEETRSFCRKSPCGVTAQFLNQKGHSTRIVYTRLHLIIELNPAASLKCSQVKFFDF